jgi:hypothetical protein
MIRSLTCLVLMVITSVFVLAQPPGDKSKDPLRRKTQPTNRVSLTPADDKAPPKKNDDPPKKSDEKKSEPAVSPSLAPTSVFVIACDSAPTKVIILDQAGKWIPSIKQVEVKFEIGSPATIVCVMYEGAIRPTNPVTKTWGLAQLKTVPATNFQQMIDTLQTNPDAIREMLKKED